MYILPSKNTLRVLILVKSGFGQFTKPLIVLFLYEGNFFLIFHTKLHICYDFILKKLIWIGKIRKTIYIYRKSHLYWRSGLFHHFLNYSTWSPGPFLDFLRKLQNLGLK